MNKTLFQQSPPPIPPLALRPKEAAEALGISERLLLDWTAEYGLPCLRLGRVVLYPVDSIRGWLRSMCRSQEVLADNTITGSEPDQSTGFHDMDSRVIPSPVVPQQQPGLATTVPTSTR
jgi:excisionase family DNA binding protein